MKKVLLFCSTLVITIFAFSLVASANEQLLSTNGENQNDLFYDNLKSGERVVGFYTEIIPMSDSKMPLDSVTVERLISSIPDSKITPFTRTLTWYLTSKRYIGESYGSWLYAGAETLSGGVLSATHTSSVSNMYSGQLNVKGDVLGGFVGFNITETSTQAVSYSTLPIKPVQGKKHRLDYRNVYQKYEVKQEKKYDSRGVTYETSYVYPQKWVQRQYRVVELNAK